MKKIIAASALALAALTLTGCASTTEAPVAEAPAVEAPVVEVVEAEAPAVNTAADYEAVITDMQDGLMEAGEAIDAVELHRLTEIGQDIIATANEGYELTTGDPEVDQAWQAIMMSLYEVGATCESGTIYDLADAVDWFETVAEENAGVIDAHFGW